MIGTVQFEVLPLPGIAQKVAAHLPAASRVTVTASPRHGLDATLSTAQELSERGATAIPHLAARQVRDRSHLRDLLARMDGSGIREAFVIAGDVSQSAGGFPGTSELLEAIAASGHELALGIGAHPEGHPFVSEVDALELLRRRSRLATYVVTQMCFSAETLVQWISRLRNEGIDVPVRPGIAGPISTGRLVKISGRIGVGASLSLLTHHSSGIRHLLGPRPWRPDDLLEELAAAAAQLGVDGWHLYTFNALQETGRWLDRQDPSGEQSA